MSKRHRKTPAAPKWKPKRLKDRRAPADARGAPATTTVKFYAGQFSPDELALIAACVQDLQLDDEVWLQRVVNLRLLGLTDAEAEADQDAAVLKHLVRVAQALTTGAGRMARLLRDRRVLSGEAVDALATAVTTALDEFMQLTGVIV